MEASARRLTRIEERYTQLEHHVAEQDRVILGLAEKIDRLAREVERLRSERAETSAPGEFPPADERPPHY